MLITKDIFFFLQKNYFFLVEEKVAMPKHYIIMFPGTPGEKKNRHKIE